MRHTRSTSPLISQSCLSSVETPSLPLPEILVVSFSSLISSHRTFSHQSSVMIFLIQMFFGSCSTAFCRRNDFGWWLASSNLAACIPTGSKMSYEGHRLFLTSPFGRGALRRSFVRSLTQTSFTCIMSIDNDIVYRIFRLDGRTTPTPGSQVGLSLFVTFRTPFSRCCGFVQQSVP